MSASKLDELLDEIEAISHYPEQLAAARADLAALRERAVDAEELARLRTVDRLYKEWLVSHDASVIFDSITRQRKDAEARAERAEARVRELSAKAKLADEYAHAMIELRDEEGGWQGLTDQLGSDESIVGMTTQDTKEWVEKWERITNEPFDAGYDEPDTIAALRSRCAALEREKEAAEAYATSAGARVIALEAALREIAAEPCLQQCDVIPGCFALCLTCRARRALATDAAATDAGEEESNKMVDEALSIISAEADLAARRPTPEPRRDA